jgi:hypothetical protein
MNKPMMTLSLKASESMGLALEVHYSLQVARIEPQALLLGYRASGWQNRFDEGKFDEV